MTDVNRERALEELQRLYDMLPTIECKGLCWNSCGPIDMSDVERDLIRRRGYEIEPFTLERSTRWANDEPLHCSALQGDKTCAVYDVRPLICRLWGVAESMPCTNGCKPNPGYVTDEDGMHMIAYSIEVGGKRDMDVTLAKMREAMEDPVTGPLMKRLMRGDRTAEAELLAVLEERDG